MIRLGAFEQEEAYSRKRTDPLWSSCHSYPFSRAVFRSATSVSASTEHWQECQIQCV